MPQQIKYLFGFAVVLVFIFLIVRHYLVSPSFGQYGHYRATSLQTVVSQEIKYGGEIACTECHEDILTLKNKSYHRGVACEVCHSAAYAHTQDPYEHKPPAPRTRAYCPLCHGYNPTRPTGFPQIDPVRHNPAKPCISCHNPHDPTPPVTPKECEPCHTEIARTKILSPHAPLPCTQCHEAKEEHKLNPRVALPSKPRNREFCGQCHSQEAESPPKILQAESPPEIPRVDMKSHYSGFLCWECHYPHYPEARLKKEEETE